MNTTTTNPISEIAELLNQMRRTNNDELRKHYAQKGRLLLKIAEKHTPSNPEAQAGLRRARVELEQVIDYQFPGLSRQDEIDKLSKRAGLSAAPGNTCTPLGVFNTTTIVKGCSWATLVGVGGVLYLLGRAHRKKVARRKARARARARARRKNK